MQNHHTAKQSAKPHKTMKKTALLVFASFIVALHASAQVKLGFKFSPNIAFNSTVTEGIYDGVSPSGASVRFSAGPIADFFFADNYAFHTGLWYTLRRTGIEGRIGDGVQSTDVTSLYNVQYLQVPVAFKFYTNEVATDLRIYFLVGGTIDVKIAEKPKDKNANWLYARSQADDKRAFKPADVGLLLGAGGELVMGTNTALFFGLSYNRGLTNALGNPTDDFGNRISSSLKVRNSLIALDLGVKF